MIVKTMALGMIYSITTLRPIRAFCFPRRFFTIRSSSCHPSVKTIAPLFRTHGTQNSKHLRVMSRQTVRLAGTSSSGDKSEADTFFENLGTLLDEQQEKKDELDSTQSTENNDSHGWRFIDWKALFDKQPQQPASTPSPVDRILIRNRLVHVKRDDQLKLSGAPISGNKARKMMALNHYCESAANGDALDFPSCVVSFGGPQSNAMLALAAVVHFQNQKARAVTADADPIIHDNFDFDDSNESITKDVEEELNQYSPPQQQTPLKRFVYYTKKLPRFLRNQPNGNLFRALTLGMELIELAPDEYANLFGGEWGGPTEPPPIEAPVPGDSLWVSVIGWVMMGCPFSKNIL